MNTYTQIQGAKRVLRRTNARRVMVDYITSAVRREMFLHIGAPQEVLDGEERRLQETWYALRKWAHPLSLSSVVVKRNVVQYLRNLVDSIAEDYPGMTKARRMHVKRRIVEAGFPGLFMNPDPSPEG